MDSTLDTRASIDALFACMATAKSSTFAVDGLLRVYLGEAARIEARLRNHKWHR
jgi:hypothetical protein